MFRAILELLITIFVIIVARALLTSVFKGFLRATSTASRNRGGAFDATPQSGGELHKDPVCGTYVAETTAFRRQFAGQTFYYCSVACREKHALVSH